MADPHPPRLALPFAVRHNLHVPTVEKRLLGWARGHGLVRGDAAAERFGAARFTRFAGYIHPDASADDLYLYARFLAWEFLADDRYAQDGLRSARAWERVIAHLEPVYRTGTAGRDASPVACSLADILGRVYSHADAQWRERFTNASMATLYSVVPGNSRRENSTCPGVDEFIRRRRIASGHAPCQLIDEFMTGGRLPPTVRDGALLAEIRTAETDVVSWTNDYYSCRKEEGAGGLDNFVLVLERAEKLDRAQAQDAVARRIQDRVADFLLARRELLGRVDESVSVGATDRVVRACVETMHNWMAGTDAWSRESRRYRLLDAGAAVRVPNYVEELLDLREPPGGGPFGDAGW
ncbi:hypothetical protein [Streptomyces sp. SID3343]|uniref:terpene synthase family protein n=1 Tax=Streptomyces sp. SID3343 TaxID=2690260 RepID=UPI00136F253A|nr:hypothetical protein [Streptomyces sp. SID3343]MYW02433.1 hypothetical protein [Streptomyces sp. SID3343]